MKVKLLKKLRSICALYQRGNEYRYVCELKCIGDVRFEYIDWTTDKQRCLNARRNRILELARKEYKPYKKKL